MKLSFQFDDGGRAAAGFKGKAGDCVCRAVAIASGRPYLDVYRDLAALEGSRRRSKHRPNGRARTARNGVSTRTVAFKAYMAKLGFEWTPTMAIGSGCQVHLHDNELPAGRIIVSLSGHVAAIIDGVIRDSHDPRRESHYVESPGDHRPLRPGEWRNTNGICGVSRRCVYGYWRLAR